MPENNNLSFCAGLVSVYLAGKEMPADFHKDLVVLVRSLVPRYNDLCTRQVLQLVNLKHIMIQQRLRSWIRFHLQAHLLNTDIVLVINIYRSHHAVDMSC